MVQYKQAPSPTRSGEREEEEEEEGEVDEEGVGSKSDRISTLRGTGATLTFSQRPLGERKRRAELYAGKFRSYGGVVEKVSFLDPWLFPPGQTAGGGGG